MKTLETVEEIKRYKIVFDKRVVDSVTFKSYPYDYQKGQDMDDEEMNIADALLNL